MKENIHKTQKQGNLYYFNNNNNIITLIVTNSMNTNQISFRSEKSVCVCVYTHNEMNTISI
jgi:hypothetical protein